MQNKFYYLFYSVSVLLTFLFFFIKTVQQELGLDALVLEAGQRDPTEVSVTNQFKRG